MHDTIKPPPVTTTECYGGCPACGRTDGYRNVGRDHWFFCAEHRVRWWAGSNLFSSWRGETEAAFRENIAFMEPFTEVTPLDNTVPPGDEYPF